MSRTARHGLGGWIAKQNGGLWFGLAFLAFAAIYFWNSLGLTYQSRLGPGPGMYPRWLGGASILVALAYIGQSLTGQIFLVKDHFPGRAEMKGVSSVVIACIAFIALLGLAGFVPAGVLMVFIVMYRSYRPLQALAWSLAITVATYVVFKVFFSVPFPAGSLFALLAGGK